MKSNHSFIKQISSFLVLSAITSSVYANTVLQDVRITIHRQNAPISRVLDDIEEQTGYSILIRNNDINVRERVSVNAENKTLEQVLASVFRGMNVRYDVSNNTISIYKPETTVAMAKTASQQKRIVQGIIVDKNNEPVIGANIIERGDRTNGTITDIEGKFSLNVEENASLEVSYIGYKTLLVSTKGKSDLRIVLSEDTEALDEVVVVGYMTQKKTSLTGSVATMKMEENLSTIPTSSATDLLSGKMAGVNITTVNGLPGEKPTLSIRTTTSWKEKKYNPQPVTYVIDGVVRDEREFNNLSANEIDNISVLKDAASAAIYGSRSSGGVVIVTTKKGKTGKPSINYSYGFSVDARTKSYDLTDGVQTALIYNRVNPESTQKWTQEEIDHIASINDGYGYNQLDEVWQSPTTQTHNFSISGGSDRIQYFGAASYIKQQGFLNPLTYDKYNIRMNVTAKVTKDFELFTGFALNNDKKGLIASDGTDWKYDTYGKLRIWQPEQPVFTDSGKFIDYGWIGNVGARVMGADGYRHDKRLSPSFIVKGTYNMPFLEGLSASLQYSKSWTHETVNGYYTNYDMYVTKHSGANGRIMSTRDEDILSVKRATQYNRDYIRKDSDWGETQQLNFYLNYHNTFNDVHRVDAVVLTEWSESFSDNVYGLRETFPFYMTDQFWAANSSREYTEGGGDASKMTGRMSYVGQFNYAYADKYLLSFSFREDGSMNFAPGQRWGFFPAGSVGWVISEESFFNPKYIQFLKLRGSVGLTGDDSVGGWQWQESYIATGDKIKSAYFGKTPTRLAGMGYGTVVNPNLTWEKALSYNVGLDANFLDHWNLSLDYWYRKSYDILDNRMQTLPTTYSREMPAENYGKMRAQGVDFQLGYRGQSRDFSYWGNLTLSYGWNEILYKDYAENAQWIDIPIGTSTSRLVGLDAIGIIRTQEELDAFNEANPNYTFNGIKPELGMLVYKDHSGPNGVPDGMIDDWDRIVLRAKNFPVNYGLNLGGSWKGLSIDMMFSGKLGEKKSFRDLAGNVEWNRMWSEWYDNSWTPENPNAMLPKQVSANVPSTYRDKDSQFWYRSTNFLWLKYLTISYDLPKNQFYNKIFDNVRVFVTGSNLFCLSHFKYYDPELESGNAYPIMRSFNFGIDVKF